METGYPAHRLGSATTVLAALHFLTEQVFGDSYRLGRFPHGHLKLCHVHHPLVPNDGKITAEQIDAVTKAKDR
jgi:hypothetical protein